MTSPSSEVQSVFGVFFLPHDGVCLRPSDPQHEVGFKLIILHLPVLCVYVHRTTAGHYLLATFAVFVYVHLQQMCIF